MDRATALRKIQKCLSLSKSSEPHEAARALAQAQALMAEFDVEHPELLAAGASASWARSKATARPPEYEAMLADGVASAFGCSLVFRPRLAGDRVLGGYDFLGVGPAGEIANYTYTVLTRKLAAARTAYTATALKRYRKNKVAAADEFCVGWVRAVRRTIAPVTLSIEHQAAIDAYVQVNYHTTALKTTSREVANARTPQFHKHIGYAVGSKERVAPGVGAGERSAQLGLSLGGVTA